MALPVIAIKVNGSAGQHSARIIPVLLPMLRRPIISDISPCRVPPPSLEGPKGRPPPCPSLPTDRAPTLLPVGARSCFFGGVRPFGSDTIAPTLSVASACRRAPCGTQQRPPPLDCLGLRHRRSGAWRDGVRPAGSDTRALKLPGNCRFQIGGNSVGWCAVRDGRSCRVAAE